MVEAGVSRGKAGLEGLKPGRKGRGGPACTLVSEGNDASKGYYIRKNKKIKSKLVVI